ncbi:MAG: hypothetical protein CMI28_03295 [Opitutae bacterium]|nr:hypothetical protein [Opitutae bacterium]
MKYLYLVIPSFFFLSCLIVNGEWNQFRGVNGQGHADARIPQFWSQNSSNLSWRTSIKGMAWSSPILVRDQIVVTNARTLSDGKSLVLEVVALNESTGEIIWRSSLFTYTDLPRIHRKNSYASPTPYFDGEFIFVHYGNLGTACLNTQGKTLWKKVFDYSPVHGSGSSPVVYDNLLIFSADGASDPSIYGINKKNGNVLWKTIRASKTKKNFSFCTPLVVPRGSVMQIISPASEFVFSYSLEGKEIWKFNYPGGYSVVPRPVFADGIVFVSSGYDRPTLYAIKTDGIGDVTGSKLIWKTSKSVPRNSSIIVIDNLLFMAADNGVVSCLNATTGSTHWIERVGGSCSSSLLHANGSIYLTDETGKTFVFEAKREYQLSAVNDLKERTLASSMAYNSSVFIRTEKAIYRFDTE